jgi:DNA (cytosine-5)-methyltransferase 1
VAWSALGWRPAFFSEIEPFPRAVLAERWPGVPIHGDFTTIREGDYEPIDLLVCGTPCQDFSVAGLRAGLAGERGFLTIEFVRLAERLRPRWLVWENVPGVLSSDDGRAFGIFLGALGECGYGTAWRVCDAQYFGVPQRRRRVFVIGYLGDWRPPAAVLFERESLRGDSAPRYEARQAVAGSLGAGSPRSGKRLGRREAAANRLIALRGHSDYGDGLPSLRFKSGDCGGGSEALVIAATVSARWGNQTGGYAGAEHYNLVTHSLRAEGFDASEDGTGRGVPLIAVDCYNGAIDGDVTHSTRAGNGNALGGVPAVMTLAIRGRGDSHDLEYRQDGIRQEMSVRRLTPRECERLQGFPDDYTLITYRSKPAADGPRYRALGNSMAVPCMKWLGKRIAMVEELL